MNPNPLFLRMLFRFFTLCLPFIWLELAAAEGSVAETNAARVTKEMVFQARAESLSVYRDKYVQIHSNELRMSSAITRFRAAWFLGQIQSAHSLAVLLSAADSETNVQVIHVEWDSISQLLFFDLFEPVKEPINEKEEIEKIRVNLITKSYDQYITVCYERAKTNGLEGERLFLVSALKERYDPQLTPLLLKMWSEETDETTRSIAAKTLLVWSGFDISSETSERISAELKEASTFSRSKLLSRYRAFLDTKGLGSVTDSPNKAISAAQLIQDETQRDVVFRVALILTDENPGAGM